MLKPYQLALPAPGLRSDCCQKAGCVPEHHFGEIISPWKYRGAAKHSASVRELACIGVIVHPPLSHEFPVAAYFHYSALIE